MIDFSAIASAALGLAESLLAEWLPSGKRDGHEWKSVNPTRADRSAGSFSVSLTTGAWGDFATDDRGGDLVSLYAYLFTAGDQGLAARELGERLGVYVPPASGAAKRERQSTPPAEHPAPEPDKPSKRTLWVPVTPVPADAEHPPKAHVVRGAPQAQWCYRDASGQVLGYIYRFVTSDGGKEVLPLSWCRHEVTGKGAWRWISFATPRPLYGLDRLADRPEATVLVTEGEKCSDAAASELPDLVSVSWPGGSKAVDKADWLPLAGRKVVLWPDCDAQTHKHTQEVLPEWSQPGWMAANKIAGILTTLGCKVWTVRIPAPGERNGGWDVADAIAEGLTGEALASWVRERLEPYDPPGEPAPGKSAARKAGAGGGEECGGDVADDAAQARGNWQRNLLYTQKGDLATCLSNVHDILLNSSEWQGVLGFDEFAARTNKRLPAPYFGGEPGEWTAADDSRTAMWLTRKFRFAPPTALVAEAVETLALAYTYHPVRLWLRGLPKWDGIDRLESWLMDYVGVRDSAYARLVGKWFFVGMIARVMRPGVKFDYCLVLEGAQGKRKSTVASTLGGEWFGDTDLDLQNKDAMSALRGKLIYEFPEMGSVTRVESSKQKSFLSRQFDEFRPVYGRREIKLSRQCVFVGTTNEWEWNKDPTGGRRFWPVEVGEINIVALSAMREQLFAEALSRFEAGEKFWPDAEEQRTLFDPEQLAREQPESLIDALHDWVFCQVSDFSLADAVMNGLKLDASKLTRDLTTRVGVALRKLGCERVERRNGMIRFWYKPPTRNGATSKTESIAPAQLASSGERHVPF